MKIQPPALPISLDHIKSLALDRHQTPTLFIDRDGKILEGNKAFWEWSKLKEKTVSRKKIADQKFIPDLVKELLSKFSPRSSIPKKLQHEVFLFQFSAKHQQLANIHITDVRDEKKKYIARMVCFHPQEETLRPEEQLVVKQKVLQAVSSAAENFLKVDSWEKNMVRVLGKIGKAIELDGFAMYFNDMRRQKYEWSKEAHFSLLQAKELDQLLLGTGTLASITKKLKLKQTIIFDQNHKHADVAVDLNASIFLPVFVEGKWWGYLLAVDKNAERIWLDSDVEALQMSANIITAAIHNTNVQIELRQTVEYLKLEKEHVLREVRNTQKFQQAVDAATDGIVITTPKPEILYVNPIWQELTGYTADEAVGKNPNILQSKKTPQKVYQEMWSHLTKQQPFTTEEIINTRKDGTEYPAHLSVFPIVQNGETQFYVGIHQDITKRMELDKRKTEFISIASHQLNTPLSGMKWFLELLMLGKGGELNPTQKSYLQNVIDSNANMISLVRSLLNISRIESGRIIVDPKPTSIKELVTHLIGEIRPQAEKRNQKITLNIARNVPLIKIDPKLIQHVYLNLLSNAIKYSPDNSTISLTIRKNRDSIVSCVKDSGYGIPKSEQSKLFEKFFRAENVRRREVDGSGLGLYLVKTVVESSGGEIWVNSEEDKGSEFCFSLPLKGSQKKAGEVTLDPHHQW